MTKGTNIYCGFVFFAGGFFLIPNQTGCHDGYQEVARSGTRGGSQVMYIKIQKVAPVTQNKRKASFNFQLYHADGFSSFKRDPCGSRETVTYAANMANVLVLTIYYTICPWRTLSSGGPTAVILSLLYL